MRPSGPRRRWWVLVQCRSLPRWASNSHQPWERFLSGEEMQVVVTGSREFRDVETLERALGSYLLQAIMKGVHLKVVVGDCPTGADQLTREWARRQVQEVWLVVYQADWENYGKAAGTRRNTRMIQRAPDRVLAFYQPGAKNLGTGDCVRQAKNAGIPIDRFYSAVPVDDVS